MNATFTFFIPKITIEIGVNLMTVLMILGVFALSAYAIKVLGDSKK